ncbi:MAG: ribonuclease HII [Pseudomonadota bacterium]|nr:ribonuclease HII [Pseudomonadota bacterium]
MARRGQRFIIGVDEAGRGPLAGPVVAAAVALDTVMIKGLNDSKRLSGKARAILEVEIKASCRWAIGVVHPQEIDRVNIFMATMQAMTAAVASLCAATPYEMPHEVLIDGNLTPHGRTADWCWPARAIVGGDASEPCISAASIIAKEHRDRLMRALAQDFTQYGWATNVGYGTPEHLAALQRHGPTPHHRRSFAPVAQLVLI